MQVGTAIHRDLQLEVTEEVEVATETREDRLAVKLLNTMIGVLQLLQEGLTRELFVYGTVKARVAGPKLCRSREPGCQRIAPTHDAWCAGTRWDAGDRERHHRPAEHG